MSKIRVYKPEEAEYQLLQKFCQFLNERTSDVYQFYLNNIYFDFGQNWKYTAVMTKERFVPEPSNSELKSLNYELRNSLGSQDCASIPRNTLTTNCELQTDKFAQWQTCTPANYVMVLQGEQYFEEAAKDVFKIHDYTSPPKSSYNLKEVSESVGGWKDNSKLRNHPTERFAVDSFYQVSQDAPCRQDSIYKILSKSGDRVIYLDVTRSKPHVSDFYIGSELDSWLDEVQPTQELLQEAKKSFQLSQLQSLPERMRTRDMLQLCESLNWDFDTIKQLDSICVSFVNAEITYDEFLQQKDVFPAECYNSIEKAYPYYIQIEKEEEEMDR